MKEMRYIRLETVDGETYDIPLEYVIEMRLEGVCETHEICPNEKSLKRTENCQSAHLVLGGEWDKEYKDFPLSIYRRLNLSNDVFSIAYLDGEKGILERIYLPWDWNEEDVSCDEENNFQSSGIDGLGNLTIEVKRR